MAKVEYFSYSNSFAHILFATGVPQKLFDKLRAVDSVERPRPVGGRLHFCGIGLLAEGYMIHFRKILEGPYLSFRLRGFNILTVPWRKAVHGVAPVSIPGGWHRKDKSAWTGVILEVRVERLTFFRTSMDESGREMN